MNTLRYNAHLTSGNASGLVAGSVIPGNPVNTGDTDRQKIRQLSALVGVTAATASLTFTSKWQGSNDGSTWTDLAQNPQNTLAAALTTGTATAITKAVPAPEDALGCRYVRCCLVTGGATAGASDLWSIGYQYRVGPQVS